MRRYDDVCARCNCDIGKTDTRSSASCAQTESTIGAPAKQRRTPAGGGGWQASLPTMCCQTGTSISWGCFALRTGRPALFEPPGADPHAGWCGRGRPVKAGRPYADPVKKPACAGCWLCYSGVQIRHPAWSVGRKTPHLKHFHLCLQPAQAGFLNGSRGFSRRVINGLLPRRRSRFGRAVKKIEQLPETALFLTVAASAGTMRGP